MSKEIKDTVKLMLNSSDHNPYSGKISREENYLAAIELAELCKKFSENGQEDEAMNLDTNHWTEVINELNQNKDESRRNRKNCT